MNWNGYWAFDGYSIWTIYWYLMEHGTIVATKQSLNKFIMSSSLENDTSDEIENLRGPGSALVFRQLLDMVSLRGLQNLEKMPLANSIR